MSERIVIVDVGLGNLRSVAKAVETAGAGASVELVRSSDPSVVRSADRLVVPGQGEFGNLADRLEGGLGDAIRERLEKKTPYLGICLGLQILFETSEEAPGKRGLGWFAGSVKRLVGGPSIKIPHMGWNQLEPQNGGHPLLPAGEWFYFVHSYHAVPDDPTVVRATCGYGDNRVTAAVG
ncbi:MAG TPA: imidazole glycerol phosphate synthase subunit HisH, partial [Polyangiaceae bacterium]|nr:imidazole glycerol phosphate synthase subunit HisH [Polyangiaceae bacterium]